MFDVQCVDFFLFLVFSNSFKDAFTVRTNPGFPMMFHHYLIYHRAESQLAIARIAYSSMQTFVKQKRRGKKKSAGLFHILP